MGACLPLDRMKVAFDEGNPKSRGKDSVILTEKANLGELGPRDGVQEKNSCVNVAWELS